MRPPWAIAYLALALAGCQTAAETESPPASPARAVDELATPASLATRPVPAPPPQSVAPVRPNVQQAQVVPSRAPLLARLNGSGPERLQIWLGAPNLKRRDAPAEIWRYDAADCALFVFLYRKDAKAALRIAHASAIWRAQGTAAGGDPQPCFERLWQARHEGKAGGRAKPAS